MPRLRILRVIASLDPAHGGPGQGLRALTPVLAGLGHDSEFVTLDDPASDAARGIDAPVHALGPAPGAYGRCPRLRPWLEAQAGRFDAVLVHGLWQQTGLAVRQACLGRVPYFVFPHGMLDPALRRAYPARHLKKWAYWLAVERHNLAGAGAVLYTCPAEMRLAARTFLPYRCTARAVAYGTAAPAGDPAAARAAFLARVPALGAGARPYLLFLGRIHDKKGVDLLIGAYRDLASRPPAPGGAALPALVIAGPSPDAAYLARLRAMASTVPAPGLVLWPGMLEEAAKTGALLGASALVLPSHQENFGIAVVEALACGTPALISDRVNIWEDIVADGAGLCAPDTREGTLDLLARWTALPPAARAAMRGAALASFGRRYEIGRVAASLVETLTPFLRRA